MIQKEDLLEPKKAFKTILEKEHHENAAEYFDELVKKSNVDCGANKETCKKYYAFQAKDLNLQKKITKSKVLKILMIILGVALIISSIVAISLFVNHHQPQILYGIWMVAGFLLGVFLIVFFAITQSKKIKLLKSEKSDVDEKMKKELTTAEAQMAPLNALYDWNIHIDLFKKTLPLVDLDNFFDIGKVDLFENKYGLNKPEKKHESLLFVQSGSILGNPFLIATKKTEAMKPHVYTGTKRITWTETHRDSKGHSYTVVRTETLVAHVTKPKPDYTKNTTLYYGCEAAPSLSFSREPKKVYPDSDDAKRKFVEKEKKKLTEYANNNKGFTPLGNDEFDAFFGGIDRDNEVEYRVLFTPLAQKNILDIIENKEPFGDDFTFVKRKMLNAISSEHSQISDFVLNPQKYHSFDMENARKNFIDMQDYFFKSLFFDLAPLLSIPLYQQMPSDEYIFKKKNKKNISEYEVESVANLYNQEEFEPDDCMTELILNCNYLNSEKQTDFVNITAYGYRGEDRVDFVTKMGGDGHLHQVPVPWIEYFPIEKTTPMTIGFEDINAPIFNSLRKDKSFEEFKNKYVRNNAIIYKRGLFSYIPKATMKQYAPMELNEILKKQMKNKEE